MNTFEQNLAKLEQLTSDIKRSDISLEDALKDFEEGIKLAKSIEKKDVAKRNQCMQLIEPLLILCTGLYILILVETIVLPFLTSFGGI